VSKRSPQRRKVVQREIECNHCNRFFTRWHFPAHERSCRVNPKNTEECPVCGIEFYARNGKRTCSTSCGATYRSDAGHPPPVAEATKYQTIAFQNHERKCAIPDCSERRILEVHHYNNNHDDNSPENLVPMCPTHHRYMHSRFRYVHEMAVDIYVAERWGREINKRYQDYHRCINYEYAT
jgi:hypothetical protein